MNVDGERNCAGCKIMEFGFSFGSNLGDRLANLSAGKAAVLALPGVRWIAQSFVYETEPVGVSPLYQKLKYLNAILIVECDMDPLLCRDRLKAIEAARGRPLGGERNAPRPLDIDIIYAGDLHWTTGELIIPHARWREREFVVRPLADVRPNLVLPGETQTIQKICDTMTNQGVLFWTREW